MPHHDFTELDQFAVDPRSVQLLDEEFCRERQVVVLGVVDRDGDGPVTVAMLEPGRRSLAREVAARLGREVRPVRLNAFEIRRALDCGWGLGDPAAERSVLDLAPIGRPSFRDDLWASADLCRSVFSTMMIGDTSRSGQPASPTRRSRS